MNLFCAVQSAGALLIQHLPCGEVPHAVVEADLTQLVVIGHEVPEGPWYWPRLDPLEQWACDESMMQPMAQSDTQAQWQWGIDFMKEILFYLIHIMSYLEIWLKHQCIGHLTTPLKSHGANLYTQDRESSLFTMRIECQTRLEQHSKNQAHFRSQGSILFWSPGSVHDF